MNKMKQRINNCIVIVLLLFVTIPFARGNGDNNNKDWALARESGGVSIYYRWILDGSQKTREMRAQFVVNAGVSQILPLFSGAENYRLWAAGVKECRVELINDSNWVTYTAMVIGL
ncbi:MAG: hypothetical protein EOM73_14825, partial [Bacteroidia bacterium]|nr:hypothetical protein [Bacteroidia bacterium]